MAGIAPTSPSKAECSKSASYKRNALGEIDDAPAHKRLKGATRVEEAASPLLKQPPHQKWDKAERFITASVQSGSVGGATKSPTQVATERLIAATQVEIAQREKAIDVASLAEKMAQETRMSVAFAALVHHQAAKRAFHHMNELQPEWLARYGTRFDAAPLLTMPLQNYLNGLRATVGIDWDSDIYLIAMLYFKRATSIPIRLFNVHRLVLTSLCIADKFIGHDTRLSERHNALFAQAGKISTKELNQLEVDLLQAIHFEAGATSAELDTVLKQMDPDGQLLLSRFSLMKRPKAVKAISQVVMTEAEAAEAFKTLIADRFASSALSPEVKIEQFIDGLLQAAVRGGAKWSVDVYALARFCLHHRTVMLHSKDSHAVVGALCVAEYLLVEDKNCLSKEEWAQAANLSIKDFEMVELRSSCELFSAIQTHNLAQLTEVREKLLKEYHFLSSEVSSAELPPQNSSPEQVQEWKMSRAFSLVIHHLAAERVFHHADELKLEAQRNKTAFDAALIVPPYSVGHWVEVLRKKVGSHWDWNIYSLAALYILRTPAITLRLSSMDRIIFVALCLADKISGGKDRDILFAEAGKISFAELGVLQGQFFTASIKTPELVESLSVARAELHHDYQALRVKPAATSSK